MPIRMQRPRPCDDLGPLERIDAAWLRRLFEQALRGSLVGSFALAGCAGAHLESASPDGGAEPTGAVLRCHIGPDWQLADGFALAHEVDYLADRDADRTLSAVGSPCANAADQRGCQTAVELALRSVADRHLLTTERDVVRIWQNPGALALLGDIDTPHEALWVVATSPVYEVRCPQTYAVETAHGIEVHGALRADQDCPTTLRVEAVVRVDLDGELAELSSAFLPDQGCAIPGRRPPGLRSMHRRRGAPPLGEHFAAMAHMEAASVPAFALIGRELAQHGAPHALRVQAARAQRDEQRHARLAAHLALRFGARPSLPSVRPERLRTLDALALDNAVEGCIHETYAALEASHQARHARDPEIARTLTGIAADETRHAALSWQIHAWALPRLSQRAQRRILAAQRRAARRLGERVTREVDEALCSLAGLPDAATARALYASVDHALWRAAARATAL
jgi:hypothetical protein